jgi:hypothetical protein
MTTIILNYVIQHATYMEYVTIKKLASDKNTQDRGSPQYVQTQDQRSIVVDEGWPLCQNARSAKTTSSFLTQLRMCMDGLWARNFLCCVWVYAPCQEEKIVWRGAGRNSLPAIRFDDRSRKGASLWALLVLPLRERPIWTRTNQNITHFATSWLWSTCCRISGDKSVIC